MEIEVTKQVKESLTIELPMYVIYNGVYAYIDAEDSCLEVWSSADAFCVNNWKTTTRVGQFASGGETISQEAFESELDRVKNLMGKL